MPVKQVLGTGLQTGQKASQAMTRRPNTSAPWVTSSSRSQCHFWSQTLRRRAADPADLGSVRHEGLTGNDAFETCVADTLLGGLGGSTLSATASAFSAFLTRKGLGTQAS